MAAALVQAKALLDAMRGLGERAVDVAVVDALPRHEIVRAVESAPWARRAKPGDRIGHRRQCLEIERDQGERVLGDAAAVGHHHRDRLADVGDLVLGQHIGIDMEADRAGRQRLRDAVGGEAAAADRRRSAPHARRAGLSPRSASIPFNRPCATGLRRNATCSAPGISRSSTKRPWPRNSGASSTRVMRRPINDVGVAVTAVPQPALRRLAHAPRRRRAVRRGSQAPAASRSRASSGSKAFGLPGIM